MSVHKGLQLHVRRHRLDRVVGLLRYVWRWTTSTYPSVQDIGREMSRRQLARSTIMQLPMLSRGRQIHALVVMDCMLEDMRLRSSESKPIMHRSSTIMQRQEMQ